MNPLDLVPNVPAAPDAFTVATEELAAGRMVLLRDDRERQGEGDLLIAAEFADAAAINFLVTEARGLVCLALSTEHCARLGLEQIGNRGNQSSLGDSAMVSIEAKEGVTTGISAGDRARTIAAAIDPASGPADLVQPGHVFPLRARPGGILERAGRTEAAVDLAATAGLGGGAVLCQLMRDDGHMARERGPRALRRPPRPGDRRRLRRGRAPPRRGPGGRRRDRPGRPADARRDGPLRHRRLGGHRARRGRRPGRHHRQRDLLGLARPAAAARLPGAELGDAGRGPRRRALRGQHPRRRAARAFRPLRQEGRRRRAPTRSSSTSTTSGSRCLPGALATIACEVEAIHPAGDHEIVVGLAHHLEHREPGAKPLLFYRGSYSEIQIEEDELAA